MKTNPSPCYSCKFAQIIELYETVFFCKHEQEYKDAAEIKRCDKWDLERTYNRDETV